MLAEEHYPLPERTQQTLEHALLNAIAQFIDSYQRKLRELIAISVILRALLTRTAAKFITCRIFRWKTGGLVEALEERFKVTCLSATISVVWRWQSTTSVQVRIAKTPF